MIASPFRCLHCTYAAESPQGLMCFRRNPFIVSKFDLCVFFRLTEL